MTCLLTAAAEAGADGARCADDRIRLLSGDTVASFSIEVVRTPPERARGLMFRPSLARDAGMLFVFDPPQPVSFWMKNTMIPLDMVFIDDTGRVVNVEANAVPYTRTPRRSEGPVRAVLEVNGGLAETLGIEPGAQAEHPAFRDPPPEHDCRGG